MILTVKILTGSPEQWQELECSAVKVLPRCEQCGNQFETVRTDAKYCSDRCRWNAQNDQRASR